MRVWTVRGMLPGMLASAALLMFASCGGSSQPGDSGMQAAIIPVVESGLPTLELLDREPAAVVNNQQNMLDGMDYCAHLPHANITELVEQNAILLEPGSEAPGISFALFQMFRDRSYRESPAYQPIVHMNLTEVAGNGPLFFLIVDYSQNRWQVIPLERDSESGLYDADFGTWDYRDNEYSVMTFGILAAGDISARLNGMRFGDGFRPTLETQMLLSSQQGATADLQANTWVYPDGDPQYGGISTVEFDFDNDGVIDNLAENSEGDKYIATETYMVPEPGVHNPRIVVTSESGAVFEYLDNVWLGEEGSTAAQASLTASGGPVHAPGEEITFDASASLPGDSAITGYSWRVENRWLAHTETPVLEYAFETAGRYEVTVYVEDASFNRAFAFVEINVSEDERSWQPAVSYETSLLGFQDHSRIGIIAGNPAMATAGPEVGSVQYVRANDAQGASWPATASIAASVQFGTYDNRVVGLLEIGGLPTVFFVRSYADESDDELYMVQGSNAAGDSWGSEQVCFSEPEFIIDGFSREVQVHLIGGIPAVLYALGGEDSAFRYRSAVDAAATGWNTATELDQVDSPLERRVHLADWDGSPCLAWGEQSLDDTDDFFFMSASASDGSAWNEEQAVHSEGSSSGADILDLAIVNGLPAIAYFVSYRPDCVEMSKRFGYQACTDQFATEWTEPKFFSRLIQPQLGRLMELDGKPALVTIGDPYPSGDLRLAMNLAENSAGTSWKAPVQMSQYGVDGYYYFPVIHPTEICVDNAGVPTALLWSSVGGVVTARFE
ncbi:MAG: PKD domain-containing protein [Planctomycetales bacterium]|nr:PKD domain-containing protein [bacterium]UNM08892.1 MAG: PKD domain-containing protein [Planctomycetales bacterium]